jgi:hypothetical protein
LYLFGVLTLSTRLFCSNEAFFLNQAHDESMNFMAEKAPFRTRFSASLGLIHNLLMFDFGFVVQRHLYHRSSNHVAGTFRNAQIKPRATKWCVSNSNLYVGTHPC